MHGARGKAGSLLAGTMAFIGVLALLTPMTLNTISARSARDRLQTLADSLALSALLSDEADDSLVLEAALAAMGARAGGLSPTLRRFATDGLRTSEVVIAGRYTPPIAFLYTDAADTVEVTGRAITWQ